MACMGLEMERTYVEADAPGDDHDLVWGHLQQAHLRAEVQRAVWRAFVWERVSRFMQGPPKSGPLVW